MIPYIAFYFFVFLISFKIKKNKFDIFDYALLLSVILFSGLRTVGADYYGYKEMYSFLSQYGNLTSRTGIGFAYFTYFMKYILKVDYQFMIMIVSIFTNLLIYLFFKKYSSKPGMSLLIYVSFGFYTTSFNMFRQMLALSFVLNGFKKIEENNRFFALASYVIAVFIHTSSIIAVVLYTLFSIIKNKELNPSLLFFISLLFVVLYDKLFPLIIRYFRHYILYLEYNSTPGIGTFMIVAVFLIIYVFVLYPRKTKINHIYGNSTFINLFTIGVSIVLLEVKNYLFFRFAFYFTVLISTLLVEWFENCFANNVFNHTIFYFCLFVYYLVYIYSFDSVIPYSCILY